MDALKTLWYIRKARVYGALVRKITKAREGLKAKGAKYQERAEHYRGLVDKGFKV